MLVFLLANLRFKKEQIKLTLKWLLLEWWVYSTVCNCCTCTLNIPAVYCTKNYFALIL